jgi:hypothetical protein
MFAKGELGLKELENDLSACMLSQWKFCAAGILMGMPLSMRQKSYGPFLIGGLTGMFGKSVC